MRCEHCDTRVQVPFEYEGRRFCCNCMSEFCSWLLDGGWIENPDQFPGIVATEEGVTVEPWSPRT